MKKTNNLKGESMNKENKQIKLISRPLDKKDGMVDLSGAFKTKVKEYKDYVVFKTTIHNDYEVWDYTYKTPTIWLCGILENLDDALDKQGLKIIKKRLVKYDSRNFDNSVEFSEISLYRLHY